MSMVTLPERASLEYLKKLAKDRLQELRRSDPNATLAHTLLSVARDHGFPSWRALKAEVERRQAARVTLLFDAARHGQLEVVKQLLAQGADPNVRESGDNTYPIHWAAASGHIEVVRALLDAGGDVDGFGDVHALNVIGWATFYHAPGADPDTLDPSRYPLVALLLERGARHHVFSAICVGDLDQIRTLVEQHPDALDRRLSRFEHGLTPLHCAIGRKRYDILDLLIELGADLEAEDGRGHTALATAMLDGDREAMTRLHAAGAKPPETTAPTELPAKMARLAASVTKHVTMISVPDVAQALEWDTSIGFKEIERYGEDGSVNFGLVSFGQAELMLTPHGQRGKHDVSLWFYTEQVDALYQLLKSQQLFAAHASLSGGEAVRGIEFEQDIEDMFYGARQFCVRDLNGYRCTSFGRPSPRPVPTCPPPGSDGSGHSATVRRPADTRRSPIRRR